MRIFACVGLVLAVFLAGCDFPAKGNGTEERLATLEKSVAAIEQNQAKTRDLLEKMVIRQSIQKRRIRRAERWQKITKRWIAWLTNNSTEGANRMEELSMIVEKMIDPVRKMQISLAQLRAQFMHLRAKQSEIVHQLPGAPSRATQKKDQVKKTKEEPAAPPVDKKKRKKVLESIAQIPLRAVYHA